MVWVFFQAELDKIGFLSDIVAKNYKVETMTKLAAAVTSASRHVHIDCQAILRTAVFLTSSRAQLTTNP
jgi:hypothetical protein